MKGGISFSSFTTFRQAGKAAQDCFLNQLLIRSRDTLKPKPCNTSQEYIMRSHFHPPTSAFSRRYPILDAGIRIAFSSFSGLSRSCLIQTLPNARHPTFIDSSENFAKSDGSPASLLCISPAGSLSLSSIGCRGVMDLIGSPSERTVCFNDMVKSCIIN